MAVQNVIALLMKAGFGLQAHGGLRPEDELGAGMMSVGERKEIDACGKVCQSRNSADGVIVMVGV